MHLLLGSHTLGIDGRADRAEHPREAERADRVGLREEARIVLAEPHVLCFGLLEVEEEPGDEDCVEAACAVKEAGGRGSIC